MTACTDERRRADARAAGENGVDSISVGDDQLTVSVILFGKAPDGLTATNFRIDGGSPVAVLDVRPCPEQDLDLPDCLQLTVDRPGDYSCYRLAIVAADALGRPGTDPYPGFDIRYYYGDFSFKQNCPSVGDCVPACPAPADTTPEPPVIDYLARDYASLRQALLDRLSLIVPAWTERHLPDVGITLVELLAYAGDLLNYRLDAVGTEAYLDTARLRTSVRRHARLLDYRMHDGCAARAFVCVTVSGELELPADDVRFTAGEVVFEPLEYPVLRPEHNEISVWTWGDADCCLPTGTTSATLVDTGLLLAPGDLLLFEEVLGAGTGLPADADRTHRQVVRLTTVTADRDPLYDKALLRVEWDRVDALGFPLCVTARGGPECTDLVIGVARGNVLLVEHGASTDWCRGEPEQPPWPPAPPSDTGCSCGCGWGCQNDGPAPVPGYPPVPFRPLARLRNAPVTQHVEFPQSRHVAAAQAAALSGIPATARATVAAMITTGIVDEAYLTALFGSVPADLPLALARFDLLLAGKLARLAELCRRARAGYVLAAEDEGQELVWAWGIDPIDPEAARFRGPAATAIGPDPRCALPAVQVTSGATRWRPRRDLLGCEPADRFFVGETDDDAVMTLRFDPATAPAPGTAVTVTYRIGNGTAGNVGAEAIDTAVFCTTRQDVITAVRNPLPAAGGVDPEPVAAVRQRAPRAFGQLRERAITAADYAELAGELPGVQRAGAQLRWTGSWYRAQVAVDALGIEQVPDWLLDDERALLHRVRRIGHEVRASSAALVPVELGLCVQAGAGYLAGHVRTAVLEVLADLFRPDNLTFGTPLRVSAIVSAVAAVPGVAGVAVSTLKRQFAPDEGAVAAGVLTFAPDEVPQLDNDPARPDRGLVTLTVGGGR